MPNETAKLAGAVSVCTVQPGQTLFGLARVHGTTVAALQRENGLRDGEGLRAGTTLRIAGPSQSTAYMPSTGTASRTKHKVRGGECLYSIARKYRTSVDAIVAANGMSLQSLRPGQVLVVPSSGALSTGTLQETSGMYRQATDCVAGPEWTCHVLRYGETLSELAYDTGNSLDEVAALNGIHDPEFLVEGQTLRLPVRAAAAAAGSSSPASSNTPAIPKVTIRPSPGGKGKATAGIASGEVTHRHPANSDQGFNLLVSGDPVQSQSRGDPSQSGARDGKDGGVASDTEYFCERHRTLKVRHGESLSVIAEGIGSTVELMMRANPRINPDLIMANQELCVPPMGRGVDEELLQKRVAATPMANELANGHFTRPVEGGWMSSAFGWKDGRSYFHEGVDVAVLTGTPVYAADGGLVSFSGTAGGYGLYVCVDHTNGFETCYAHNSALHVSKGDVVKQGARIATSGNTGAWLACLKFGIPPGPTK
eukprot:jgi/Mesvir1/29104/Mv18410-RA.1